MALRPRAALTEPSRSKGRGDSMSVASLPLTTSRSSTWARRQLRGTLASGLVIGLSASGVFLPLLAQRAMSSATNDEIGWVAVAIVIGVATTGGVWFAGLVARPRRGCQLEDHGQHWHRLCSGRDHRPVQHVLDG